MGLKEGAGRVREVIEYMKVMQSMHEGASEQFDIVFEELEYRIAKKVNSVNHENIDGYRDFYCPACGGYLGTGEKKSENSFYAHCIRCGQTLEWEK